MNTKGKEVFNMRLFEEMSPAIDKFIQKRRQGLLESTSLNDFDCRFPIYDHNMSFGMLKPIWAALRGAH